MDFNIPTLQEIGPEEKDARKQYIDASNRWREVRVAQRKHLQQILPPEHYELVIEMLSVDYELNRLDGVIWYTKDRTVDAEGNSVREVEVKLRLANERVEILERQLKNKANKLSAMNRRRRTVLLELLAAKAEIERQNQFIYDPEAASPIREA
jgi:ribosomal protein L16 Arg81 hydroxylase